MVFGKKIRGRTMNHLQTRQDTWVRRLLIGTAIFWVIFLLIIPLGLVFAEAFKGGVRAYFALLSQPESLHALYLTFIITAIVVPINAVIGICVAWLCVKHDFWGKRFLLTLLDVPFAVSPVVAGLMFVLLLGAHSALGAYLQDMGIQIIFATAGMVIATLFVTLPLIAKKLIPVMQMRGTDEELAALTLGARPWQVLWRISLPQIKWALLYGMILTAARAIGEFGAVSVVSGHIRGKTNTAPLLIEIAYNEYAFDLAFALSSLLALFAIFTLIIQIIFGDMHES